MKGKSITFRPREDLLALAKQMKTIALIFLLAGVVMATAQNQNFGALYHPAPPPSIYRFVTNQIFDITKSELWRQTELEVIKTDTNGVLGVSFSYREIGPGVHDYNRKDFGAYVLVKNYGGTPASRTEISVRAICLGATNLYTHTYTILDCGVTPEYHARQKAASTAASAPATNQPTAKK